MKIKYPNAKKTYVKTKKKTNLGMLFENAINLSNEYYLINNKAVIHKKPTPIQVVKVDYPKRTRARIVEAYYRNKSTTDYNGVYRGKYIDFEAKETNNLSFDFKHISIHQINHLKQVSSHGGIAFVIIYFKREDRIFLMDIKDFDYYFQLSKDDGKKSIPINIFLTVGIEVKKGYSPAVDYLKAVDELYFKDWLWFAGVIIFTDIYATLKR